MIWLKRLAATLLTLLLLGGAALSLYVMRSFPQIDGEGRLPGLRQPVWVQRDAADVSHIVAQSEPDAWMALGYLHAQERSWQLEFNRRVMQGQLSELFGPATLETDKLLRTLGIMPAAQAQLAGLSPQTRQALQAYSDGINAFHGHSRQALPPEFHLLGSRPGGAAGIAWQPVHSVAWAIMMALDLGDNWGKEFDRLNALQVLSTEQLWQLYPPYPGEAIPTETDFAKRYADLGVYAAKPADAIKIGDTNADPTGAAILFDTQRAAMTAWADDFTAHLGSSEGKGSNNWVVAGSHTRSGQTLLANDPHLSLSAPAIWYYAHLQAPVDPARPGQGRLNAIGATLPGLPFVVLGRTERAVWGFTNTGPDTQDLYLERINPANPAQYQTPDGWTDFSQRVEVIKVKGQSDVTFTVRSSRHGPVISDALAAYGALLDRGRFALALRWSALDADNHTVQAGFAANRARSVAELRSAYADYHSPMQNVVMADVDGQLGYQAAGRMPLRQPDNDHRGLAPAPGWQARYDWQGWLPYAQNPHQDHAAIAARGWLATANQRIHAADYPHFISHDWELPYRSQRIEARLGASTQHDLSSMRALQRDVLSLSTLKLLPYLRQSPMQHALGAAARAELLRFDGQMTANSAGALIFAVWSDEFTRGVIGGKLGGTRLQAIYGKRLLRAAIEGILERDDRTWCGAAGCLVASGLALDRALARLQAGYGSDLGRWRWGDAHPALSAHKPFGNVAALAGFFNVRVASAGDRYTVNMGHFHAHTDEPFVNRHAPSMRALYDLSDLETSQFIYQTGQSGLVFSTRYRDMSQSWADLQYRPLQMKPAQLTHVLRLQPW